MRRYRFFARGFEPNLINTQVEPLPAKAAKSGTVKVYTAEQRAALAAEMGVANDVQERGGKR
jgi:hypothetical protein